MKNHSKQRPIVIFLVLTMLFSMFSVYSLADTVAAAPTNLILSNDTVLEGGFTNRTIGTFSAQDPNVGDTFTYELYWSGVPNYNNYFRIDGNELVGVYDYDYETKSSYYIEVLVKDSAGLTFFKGFTIQILDVVNEQMAVLDNGLVRLGTPSDTRSISSNNQLNVPQQYVYTTAGVNLRELTDGDDLIDQIGVGGAGSNEWNVNGTFIKIDDSVKNAVYDATGFVATDGNKGYGTLKTTGPVSIAGATLEVTKEYTLNPCEPFVRGKTTFKNIGSSVVSNFRYWSPIIYDDLLNEDDSPDFKQKGHLLNGQFTQTALPSERTNAVKITDTGDGKDYNILLYTPDTSAVALFSNGNGTAYDPDGNVYNYRYKFVGTNPLTQSSTSITNNNGSLGIFKRFNDLAIGASVSFEYYFGASHPDTISFDDLAGLMQPASFSSTKKCATYRTNGGSSVAPKWFTSGTTLTQPIDPTKTDATFAGWHVDEALTTTFDFATPVADNVTLYAKWLAANAAPSDISLSSSSIAENNAVGTAVGTLSATDTDVGDSATFSLVSGAGDTDNASFTMDGSSLKASASFDYETKSSYSVRVRVMDSGGATYEKVFAISVSDVDDAVPTAPAGLAAGNVTATSANLTWTSSTDNVGVTGYELYNGTTLVGTTSGATTFNLTGLASGSTNSITVVAVDAANNKSVASAALTVTLLDVIAPSVPSGLASSAITQTGFTVTWSASTDNRAVRSYNVYRNGTFVANVSTNRYTFNGLTASTTHNITVLAIDTASNRSAQTSSFSVTTAPPGDTVAPSTPNNLVMTGVTSNRILLTWTPSTDNVAVTGYNVFVNNVYVKTVLAAQTDLTGLTQLTSYSIQVQALDAVKNRSLRSAALSVTTLDGQAPTVPTGLSASNITRNGFRASWTAATDNVAVTSYNVYRNGVYVATVNGTTLSYNFGNLPVNETHLVRIMAIDARGNKSAQSTPLSVATTFVADPTPPTAPTNVTSSNVTSTQVRLSWTAATDNVAVTSYNVYRNGAYVATVSGAATSYNFTGLTANTSYTFTVRAVDAEKNLSSPSDALSVTTLP